MKLRRRAVLILGIFVLIVGLLYVARQPLLRQIGAFPTVADELTPVDLIVIISGTLPEIHYGLELYHQGYGKKMLFLGHFPVELAVVSKEPFEVMEKPWDEIAAHMATLAGVPADALLFSDAFDNSTYDRVASLIRAAQEHDQKSMIIVTSPSYSRRVAMSARHIVHGGEPTFLMAPTPQSYYPEAYRFNLDDWWLDENHPKMIFDEYTKLAYYWMKYR
ncbi:MAG: ElyC/SanA/YdcF family protein [Caldilineaceae bacterium]